MSHTILLVQPTKRPEGRTYADYESVNECMEGVCKMYEEHLKRMNPNSPSITYDISQLFDFIDDLADLSCLVYRGDTQTYQPYNKDWIKEKIYVLLRRQAQQAAKWEELSRCLLTLLQDIYAESQLEVHQSIDHRSSSTNLSLIYVLSDLQN